MAVHDRAVLFSCSRLLAVSEDSRTLDRRLLLLANEKEDFMTFDEAYEELRKLAGDNAFALSYERASYFQDGIEIRTYIAGRGHAPTAVTYAGAITNMLAFLGEADPSIPDPAPNDKGETS
jgi:hypothetical protein